MSNAFGPKPPAALPPRKLLLTEEEAATVLSMCKRMMYKLRTRGVRQSDGTYRKLPFVMIGSRPRYWVGDLEQFIQAIRSNTNNTSQ